MGKGGKPQPAACPLASASRLESPRRNSARRVDSVNCQQAGHKRNGARPTSETGHAPLAHLPRCARERIVASVENAKASMTHLGNSVSANRAARERRKGQLPKQFPAPLPVSVSDQGGSWLLKISSCPRRQRREKDPPDGVDARRLAAPETCTSPSDFSSSGRESMLLA